MYYFFHENKTTFMECDSFKYIDSNLLKIAVFSFNVVWKSGLPSKSSEHSRELNPGYGRRAFGIA